MSMSCPICGANVKNPNSARHVSSKKHQNALTRKGGTGKPAVREQRYEMKGDHTADARLKGRINTLEEQMSFVINKLNQLEERLLQSNSNQSSPVIDSEIKRTIVRILPSSGSVTVDQIANKLAKYPWQSIKSILEDLVDDQIIDVAEGKSNRKLFNKYGRVIRR